MFLNHHKKIFLKGKEKSVMEDKIFEFAATKDALGQLSSDLVDLEALIKIKQESLQDAEQKISFTLQEKDRKIESLLNVTKNAIADIDNINQSIEGLL